MRILTGVFTCDWGSLGGLRPSQCEGPGLISGETRPLDRLRPCRSPLRARFGHRQRPQGPHPCSRPLSRMVTRDFRGGSHPRSSRAGPGGRQLSPPAECRRPSAAARVPPPESRRSTPWSECSPATRSTTSIAGPACLGRESELANACCECTVVTSAWCRGTGRDNSIGGDRFRLRWSNQGKRAEGCGCDLANNAAANQ
jgi:hypothetical protein